MPPQDGDDEEQALEALRALYQPQSNATDLKMPVSVAGSSTGPGTLVIPGWVRERAAEVLFAEDTEGEFDSIPGAVLQALHKVSWLRPRRRGQGS